MKVLMYGWEFPPHISGGLGVACHAMVTELSKKNVKITLVLPLEIKVQRDDFSVIGCGTTQQVNPDLTIARAPLTTWLSPYLSKQDYERLSATSSHPDLSALQQLDFFKHLKLTDTICLTVKYGAYLFAEVLYYAAVAGKLAQTVPHDVIHVHDWLTVLAGIEARRYSGKPLVFHVHALEIDRSGEDNNYNVFAIEKYGMQQADKIIAVSEFTKNTIVKYYHIAPEKIAIIHNGTYPADYSAIYHKAQRTKTVLFVGRMTQQKGPSFFIEAATKVLAFRQDVRFIMVGHGDLMAGLIEWVARLGLGRYFNFPGFLKPEEVAKIYTVADLYIMPSVSEPFGLTCLEALARNVPVIISKQSGVAGVLQHVLKVDFWDIDEMTNKILAILAHPPLVRTMLKNVKREIKALTWERTARGIIDLYNTVGIEN